MHIQREHRWWYTAMSTSSEGHRQPCKSLKSSLQAIASERALYRLWDEWDVILI